MTRPRDNIVAMSDANWYRLEPGDGTMYHVMFARVPGPACAKKVYLNPETNESIRAPVNISELSNRFYWSGWTPDTTWLVMFSWADVHHAAFVSQYKIEHWQKPSHWDITELGQKLKITKYTACILLAFLSALIENPADVASACQRAMQARATLLG